MGNDFMKHITTGIFFVDMGRVDITRHNSEEFNILPGQGTYKACTFTNLDLIKGSVFNHLHANTTRFLFEADPVAL
jgi:uncharacterized cupin superfamily protein